jgi:hypothetical protein
MLSAVVEENRLVKIKWTWRYMDGRYDIPQRSTKRNSIHGTCVVGTLSPISFVLSSLRPLSTHSIATCLQHL